MIVSQKPRPFAAELAPATREGRLRGLEQRPAARLAARLRGGSLDRALAAGADPRGSRALAARAQLLTAPARRIRVAEALEHLLLVAQGPQRRWWALSRHNSVLANSSALHELASLLRSGHPVYARGVAELNELLSDGTSPLYSDERDELALRLGRARAAIEGRADDFRTAASSEW